MATKPRITLATLVVASLQDIYDQAATHLLTQMKKCQTKNDVGDYVCTMRSDPDDLDNSLACAFGYFISDEEFTSRRDAALAAGCSDPNRLGIYWWVGEPSWDRSNLLQDLQKVHDNHEPAAWTAELALVAAKFDLIPTTGG